MESLKNWFQLTIAVNPKIKEKSEAGANCFEVRISKKKQQQSHLFWNDSKEQSELLLSKDNDYWIFYTKW